MTVGLPKALDMLLISFLIDFCFSKILNVRNCEERGEFLTFFSNYAHSRGQVIARAPDDVSVRA